MTRRSSAVGTRGMVACDNTLATAAGIEMLAAGGTAADAAVAADAVLGVVQPMSTGLGGDATCLVVARRRHRGVSGDRRSRCRSGPRARCSEPACSIPVTRAWPSCQGWSTPGPTCSTHHGRLGLEQVLQPAIRLAGDGAPVMPVAAAAWARFGQELRHDGARATFLRDGRAPAPLGRFANPALRTSLERVAAGGPERVLPGGHRRVDRSHGPGGGRCAVGRGSRVTSGRDRSTDDP